MQYINIIGNMSLTKVSIWTALSTLIKIGTNLLVIKTLAIMFGPAGLGQAGNYRQLIIVLGILSGAGIFNGITKLVAEHQDQLKQLRIILGNASAMLLCSSLLLAIIFLVAAKPISYILFGHTQYYNAIVALSIIQFSIAYANFGIAILKGLRDVTGTAFAISIGSLCGTGAFFLSYLFEGYIGAMVGLALLPGTTLLPILFILHYRCKLSLSFLLPNWNSSYALFLSKFTAMALITSITLPLAYLLIRNLLAHSEGWVAVGIWQGINSISDAYLQFITASFTVYLLPTLSCLTNKRAIAQEIWRTQKFVLITVTTLSFVLFLLRDTIIKILFSSEFNAMTDLFSWQIVGDIFKVGAYVFGYLIIARVALSIYLLAEITQFILLTLFSYWLIPCYGAIGAVKAYMATYTIYFTLCSSLFFFYLKKHE